MRRLLLVAGLACSVALLSFGGSDKEFSINGDGSSSEGFLYPDNIEQRSEYHRRMLSRAFNSVDIQSHDLFATDKKMPTFITVMLWCDGSEPLEVCTEYQKWWEYVSFEAARLVSRDDDEEKEGDGEEEPETISCSGSDFEVHLLPGHTFTHEWVGGVLHPDCCMEDVPLTSDRMSLTDGDRVECGWFVSAGNPDSLEEGLYAFRLKIDWGALSKAFPDLSQDNTTGRDPENKWFGFTYFYEVEDPLEKFNRYYNLYSSYAHCCPRKAIAWYSALITEKYPDRALPWQIMAHKLNFIEEYEEAISYYKKCYAMIEQGVDPGIVETGPDKYSCALGIAETYYNWKEYDLSLHWCAVALDVLKHPTLFSYGCCSDDSHVNGMEGNVSVLLWKIAQELE